MLAPSRSVIGVALAYTQQLQTHVDNLRQAQQILCGGNTNFIFGTNQYDMTFVLEDLQPFSTEMYTTDNMKTRAIQEVIDGVPPQERKYAMSVYNNRLDDFQRFSSRLTTPQELSRIIQDPFSWTGCTDVLVEELYSWVQEDPAAVLYNENLRSVFPTYFKSAFKNESFELTNCSNLAKYCFAHEARKTLSVEMARELPLFLAYSRLLCPVTCGCHTPWAGSMIAGGHVACPSRCNWVMYDENSAEYKDESQQECEDVDSVVDVVRQERWAAWKLEMKEMWPHTYGIVREHGCKAASIAPHLCVENSYDVIHNTWKGINYFCPRACGCSSLGSGSNKVHCPSSCLCKWELPVRQFPDANTVALMPDETLKECALELDPLRGFYSIPISTLTVKVSAKCCFVVNFLFGMIAQGLTDPSKYKEDNKDNFLFSYRVV
eukprot:TRINITY_DN37978_c0_g1_i1.p1 TRINITY_DN37978_c0_g1~~TRINITY_DN37978_c0_g1_i1.p1  ORF type:complete len:434 (-),score=31.12 TRINITY_DN37978_c0_g1_i1:317-1618(-)